MQWLRLLNDQPDNAPHTLIVGPTGQGKTTIAEVVAKTRPHDMIAIIDMKWRPSKWGGAPAAHMSDSGGFEEMEAACAALLSELQRRMAALNRGETAFDPLTIIVEELPTMIEECPSALVLFRRLGMLGRELKMRIVGMSQTDRVKPLGLTGEGDLRDNYLFLKLGDKAIERLQAAAQLARPAIIEQRKSAVAVDTSTLLEYPTAAIRPERWWSVPGQAEATPSATLWTADHIKATQLLVAEPTIGDRELGRRLFGGDGGSYAVKAKRIRSEVVSVTEIRKTSVTEPE